MIRPALVALVLFVASHASADPIVGTGRIIDGDSLDVGPVEIRLCGIDAPEYGTAGGERARRTLASLAEGRTVRCVPVNEGTPCDGRSRRMSHDRVVATCRVGGRDLARAMVEAGAACDWPRYSGGAYRVAGGCSR
ncbi:thermonuclease family protein [Jiella marina]|uniref:thermonuclease family protein n=1 Tax=Jiella sp. LLJ827 TaxID=2917712 RepID=UPI0021016E16|nr:thermonuclease family protein [Jiella sp. LLJ827]MCQ0986377.1 thermonuclease family protein [Jiella sp. LLJ827]